MNEFIVIDSTEKTFLLIGFLIAIPDMIYILFIYFYNKYYILKGLESYKEDLGIEFIDNDENYNLFLETLYICGNVIDEESNCLGVRYISSGFCSIAQHFMFEIVGILKKHELVKEGILFWLDDEIDLNNPKNIQLKLLDGRDQLESIKEIRILWSKICNSYDEYLQNVQKIENSVSMDDLEI